jgi:hypothetical protein
MALAGWASAQAPPVETSTLTITGDVVRYEPGRVIVVRGEDGKEVSYALAPSIAVPRDVQVGQKVRVYTERNAKGSPTSVLRIVTTSLTAAGQVKVTTDETRRPASGRATRTSTTTISGEVVKYEPGRTIVVREPGHKVATYTLAADASVPADIRLGENVTLLTEPVADGRSRLVRRVTTTSITPAGRTQSTTEETRTDRSGVTTTTTTTNLAGRVEAYTAGKTITVLRSDGSRATYSINSASSVPGEVEIGKTITIIPVDPREYVVQTITIRQP